MHLAIANHAYYIHFNSLFKFENPYFVTFLKWIPKVEIQRKEKKKKKKRWKYVDSAWKT